MDQRYTRALSWIQSMAILLAPSSCTDTHNLQVNEQWWLETILMAQQLVAFSNPMYCIVDYPLAAVSVSIRTCNLELARNRLTL